MKHAVECGGWCPAGRLDELGRIPDRYPVKELEEGGFSERTLANVRDADGTVIICFDKLRGGSAETAQFCVEQKRLHVVIDAAETSPEDAAQLILDLVREHKIDILNVAGPRQSEWPEGYAYVFRVLEKFLAML